MTTTARLESHPSDKDVFLLRTPMELASEMGRFGPARYSRADRAYAIHAEHLDALRQFASMISLHIIDDRTRGFTPNEERTQPIECRACGQPGCASNPPRICPACGSPWVSMTPHDIPDNTPVRLTRCPSCRYGQAGRFAYCASCGAEMIYDDEPRAATPQPVQASRGSTVGGEPVSLGVSLQETFPDAPEADSDDDRPRWWDL